MRSPHIKWISSNDPPEAFPDIEAAFDVPDGLLAAGGDLSPARLLYAYGHGIFPWFDDGQPILWWSPDPRCVLRPEEFHLSRRLRRDLSRSRATVSFDAAFHEVIEACAEDRPGQDGTWITPEMQQAYKSLYRDGWAHSVEVWRADELVGGLYGIAIGKVFFGESMFSHDTNASKIALLCVCHELILRDFEILDCQVASPHLMTLGATLMSRAEFAALLAHACAGEAKTGSWPGGRQPVSGYAPA